MSQNLFVRTVANILLWKPLPCLCFHESKGSLQIQYSLNQRLRKLERQGPLVPSDDCGTAFMPIAFASMFLLMVSSALLTLCHLCSNRLPTMSTDCIIWPLSKMKACLLGIIWKVEDSPSLLGKRFLDWPPQLNLLRFQYFGYIKQSTEPNQQEKAAHQEVSRFTLPARNLRSVIQKNQNTRDL